ncbi:MAG: ABC transporter ATP-binding protein/permease [Candidatus Krumholzibacteria bacterium]|nr:ABC transporter ATP-binding protein/permease [Candidatus Krumholzibacteria bacterium]
MAIATALLIVDALLSALSVITIAPLADLLLDKPQEQWFGITERLNALYQSGGLPFSAVSVALLVWLSMLGMSIVSVLTRWSTLRIRFEVVRTLLNDSFERIYQTRWPFFSGSNKGALINIFINEINKVGGAFLAMSSSFANVVRIAAFLSVPFIMEPTLVLVCIVGTGIVLVPFLLMGRWTYRYGKKQVKASNRISSLIKESLEGAREVIGFGRRAKTIKQINDIYEDYADSTVKAQTTAFFSSQIYEPAGFLVLLIVLFYARESGLPLSAITVVLWGIIRTIPLLKQVIHLKHQLDNFLPSLEQVRKQHALAESFKHDSGRILFHGLVSGVRVERVSYTYNNGHVALTDVSMDLPKGRVTALVGESGSGKSTLVDLLLGLQEPDRGKILIDGIPLSSLDIQTWRQRIGFVPQKPVLFDLTIRENLLWAEPEATIEDLWTACRVAGAAGFIEKLPRKLETEIGESGIRLSGGQVQRLALARAIIRKPELLILDEATSALDSQHENRIHEALGRYLTSTAILIITHRLSLARKAGMIYAIRVGRIRESGTFSELERKEGYFRTLLSSHN